MKTKLVKQTIKIDVYARVPVDPGDTGQDLIDKASAACQEIEGTYSGGICGGDDCDGLQISSDEEGVTVWFDPDSASFDFFADKGAEIQEDPEGNDEDA